MQGLRDFRGFIQFLFAEKVVISLWQLQILG